MPTNRPRPDPAIPDHEVLRQIGGGAYGEVWLARGVTGALRAVKVLWREDFEDERSFEREFEGILQYEPISREHPGLVNVLHVGRSADGTSFYYYVMELGDDVDTGTEINPIEYEARTLRSDVLGSAGKRLDTDFCIDVGRSLAEALHHLHEHDLAHRDVKPSNVIFINGRAQLADIGLVAARGRRTFVGTEGFVPPEGPGSAQADVYSLGKVLYEMATGMDRLEFPELPDELPTGAERKLWLDLNQVICEVCEPYVSRRTIQSAGEMAEAFTRLQEGRRPKRKSSVPVGGFLMSMLVGGGLMWGGWEIAHHEPLATMLGLVEPVKPPAEPVTAYIKVTSTPSGADVMDMSSGADDRVRLGQTPTMVLERKVGDTVELRIMLDGYRPYEVSAVVPASAAEEPFVIPASLKVFSPPAQDQPWTDHLGQSYRPLGEGHETVGVIRVDAWQDFAESGEANGISSKLAELETSQGPRKVVRTSDEGARRFCEWLVKTGIDAGFLTPDHEAIPKIEENFRRGDEATGELRNLQPFRVEVRQIPYGRVMVETIPLGAEIFVDDESQGICNGQLLIERVRPGSIELTTSLEGYKSETRRVDIGARETQMVLVQLEKNLSVVMGKPWENSLGMKLVPVDEGFMVSEWETRRADYEAYAKARGAFMPEPPEWSVIPEQEQWATHPVVGVSREDAEDFCRWLTEKEQGEDRLKRTLEYRLPTDLEWSRFSGLDDDPDASPAMRDYRQQSVFPWGEGMEWPPLKGAGNFAGEESEFSSDRRIEGYNDGFHVTSPVGSFLANPIGLYDLSGNAQEWVADDYSTSELDDSGLLRGGGWRSHQKSDLYAGFRNPQPKTAASSSYGFRVVLAESEEEEEDQPEEETDGND